MTDDEAKTLEEGDIVRFVTETYLGSFTTGNTYTVGGKFYHEGKGDDVSVEKDDHAEANGHRPHHFELVSRKAGPW